MNARDTAADTDVLRPAAEMAVAYAAAVDDRRVAPDASDGRTSRRSTQWRGETAMGISVSSWKTDRDDASSPPT